MPLVFRIVFSLWALGAAIVYGVAIHRYRLTCKTFLRLALKAKLGLHRQRVLLIRPCAGVEKGLLERLNSIATAQFTFVPWMRFSVAHADDSAFSICASAAETLRNQGIDAEVVIGTASYPNQKMGQLIHTLSTMKTEVDWVLSADSDVDLSGLDLDVVMTPLLDERMGATWMPSAECNLSAKPGDVASRAVLSGSLHAFCLLAGIDPKGLTGKLFAFSNKRVETSGGLAPLAQYLGEDMAFATQLGRSNFNITAVPAVAPAMAEGRTLRATVLRFSRWMRVIRAQRASLLASYPLLFFATLLWWILALSTMGMHHPWWFWFSGLSLLTMRLAVTRVARQASGLKTPWLHLLGISLLSDGVLGYSFVHALLTRDFSWRGRSLRINAEGLLVSIGDGPKR